MSQSVKRQLSFSEDFSNSELNISESSEALSIEFEDHSLSPESKKSKLDLSCSKETLSSISDPCCCVICLGYSGAYDIECKNASAETGEKEKSSIVITVCFCIKCSSDNDAWDIPCTRKIQKKKSFSFELSPVKPSEASSSIVVNKKPSESNEYYICVCKPHVKCNHKKRFYEFNPVEHFIRKF
jgi:hypothetical protein